MKPTAVSIYNKETIKEAMRALFCGRMKPENYFAVFMTAYGIILVLILAIIILSGSDTISILVILLDLFGMFNVIYKYLIYPKRYYKGLGRLRDLKVTYVFENDRMTDYSHIDGYEGTGTIRYDMLYRLVETSRYFLAFRNRQSVYIIDKAHMQNCSEDYIRNLLLSGGNTKYIKCRY